MSDSTYGVGVDTPARYCHKVSQYAVLVERDAVVREVSVLASSENAARLTAEAVVDADGAEQWPAVIE